VTKSGIILGLGEERDELLATMADLRAADVHILTLGQYLRPSAQHLPVSRFYHPDEFAELAVRGKEMGFAHVESGPLVRSSYHAKRQTDLAGSNGAVAGRGAAEGEPAVAGRGAAEGEPAVAGRGAAEGEPSG
jgi:lipoic acid synthetase